MVPECQAVFAGNGRRAKGKGASMIDAHDRSALCLCFKNPAGDDRMIIEKFEPEMMIHSALSRSEKGLVVPAEPTDASTSEIHRFLRRRKSNLYCSFRGFWQIFGKDSSLHWYNGRGKECQGIRTVFFPNFFYLCGNGVKGFIP